MRAQQVLAGLLGIAPIMSASATVSVPDLHVIRQNKGDVLVVHDAADRDRYAAPWVGWTYKPVRVGQHLSAAAYAPRYAVASPRGSTPVRGSRRWVRYGDDLLLVNVRGGRIERVLPGGYRPGQGTGGAR